MHKRTYMVSADSTFVTPRSDERPSMRDRDFHRTVLRLRENDIALLDRPYSLLVPGAS